MTQIELSYYHAMIEMARSIRELVEEVRKIEGAIVKMSDKVSAKSVESK